MLAPAAAPAASPTPPAASLSITVVNGDLTYIAEPMLIGHYRSLRLTGAEAVMNRALNEAMSASLQRGLYPTSSGTHQVFMNAEVDPDNPWQQLPRPEAVIVAGLGAEGELRGSDLVNTVRQAVIGWAQRLTERDPIPAGFTLATTLLGSGGSGITAGQAAQLIAQGVREANEQLADDGSVPPRPLAEHSDIPPRWPRVDQLTIIELYLDRASEAWNALQTLASSASALYTVSPTIARATGALRRPAEAGYRGADYDFVSALVAKGRMAPTRSITSSTRNVRVARCALSRCRLGSSATSSRQPPPHQHRHPNRAYAVYPSCARRHRVVPGQQHRYRART